MHTYQHYQESADYIKSQLNGFQPEVLMILGSGLGPMAEKVEQPIFIPYGDIPYFKRSTAIGHVGRFVAGFLGGKRVLVMQGRLHTYEGHSMEDAGYPVRVAHLLGIDSMIVTNAAGGVNTDYHVGQFMIIKDFIKLTQTSPLTGPNIDEFGPRFPDMSTPFDTQYRELFQRICQEQGETVPEGVYFFMPGPQFESAAEIRAIRILGGDAVGMSTVPEVIVANHMGMRILGVTLITNMAAGILPQPLSSEEVEAAGKAASLRFQHVMTEFVGRM